MIVLLACASLLAAPYQGDRHASVFDPNGVAVERGLDQLPGQLAAEIDALRQPVFSRDGDDVWVRTSTYKARFAPGGMTYLPFLGAQAERNHPLGLRLASAHVGTASLPLAPRGRVARRGSVMTIDRGAVDVVYDVAQDALEQQFHFDTQLPVAGDLVLNLDVATDLVGRPEDGGFTFHGPEGDVLYGAAFAIDGEGRRLRLDSVYLRGQIRLTVPEWFVARADGELYVDPVLSTSSFSGPTGTDLDEPDVAYDRSDNVFCMVFQRSFSANDVDVYGIVMDADGSFLTQFTVDSTTANVRRPQVAGLASTDQFLIVAERVEGASGRNSIVGRLHSRQTGATGPVLTIAGTGLFTTWTNRRPDVGGNSTNAAGSVFAVIFEREFLTGSLAGSTAGRVVTVAPDGTIGSTRTVETDAGATLSRFSISKSTSDAAIDHWNVAYIRTAPGEQAQIRGVQLNPDGTELSSPNRLLQFAGGVTPRSVDVSESLPVVGGGAPRYLAVYDTFGTVVRGIGVLVCRENSLGDQFALSDKDGGVSTAEYEGPGVTITYEEFVVAYHERQTDGLWRARITNLDSVGGDRFAAAEARVSIAGRYHEPRGKVALASRATGGLFSRRMMATYSGRPLTTTVHHVWRGIFEATAPYSPAPQYCPANSNSTGGVGYLRFTGTRSVGTQKGVLATGLPVFQTALLVVGTAPSQMSIPGGGQLCITGGIGRYNDQLTGVSGSGAASFTVEPWAIPQGGNVVAAAAGETWYFQVWHRDVVSPGQPTSNLTNAAAFRFE